MAEDKNIPVYFDGGGVIRSPSEIAGDPLLSKARKIELLKARRSRHEADGKNHSVLRDADLELDKLMKLNSLANDR